METLLELPPRKLMSTSVVGGEICADIAAAVAWEACTLWSPGRRCITHTCPELLGS